MRSFLSIDEEFFREPEFWCLLTGEHLSPPGTKLGGRN
jgi:hypothetical protein